MKSAEPGLRRVRIRHLLRILIAFAAFTVCGYSYAQCGTPVPMLCDLDHDRDVDQSDIDALILLDGTPVGAGDTRDLDGDRVITTLDAGICANNHCTVGACAVPDQVRKPNILVIMVDDFGYNDLAINNGNTGVNTPNMDQLAREGVRFTRHYATANCGPARAAFLSGYYPERLGSISGGISPEIVTLPERLKDEGYTTWHIGKWHIGEPWERTAWPDYQGFDHWFGFLNQDYLAGVHNTSGEPVLYFPQYYNPWLMSDSEPGAYYTGHLEDILTQKAITVLSEINSPSVPWFMYLAYFAPHAPYQPSAAFASMYPATAAGRLQALIHQLDYNIGRVINHLETLGALQNTLVVVVSDNGGTNKVLDNNAPFLGKKATLTEGGTRTPLIIRWPDGSINGQVNSEIVKVEDLYPTILETINVDVPQNLDGNSFLKNVQQLEPAHQQTLFWDHLPFRYSVLSADGRWRLESYAGVPTLYDFDLNPNGTEEVIPPPSAQVDSMTELYVNWYKDVHRVQTSFTPTDASGRGLMTGMDFQRTPGDGEFTFGIGISHDFDALIAQQAGIWEMSRSGNTVTAQFGDVILSGDITTASACHSIVVSGNFNRRFQFQSYPETVELSLYIDGLLAQSQTLETVLEVDDPTIATEIGDTTGTGTLSLPIIVNTALNADTYWSLESFIQEICAGP